MRAGFLNAQSPSVASSASASVLLEKCIRNKRKFRTEHVQTSSSTSIQVYDCVHEDGEQCTNWTCRSSCSSAAEELVSCVREGSACFNNVDYGMRQTHESHPYEATKMPSSATYSVITTGICHGYCKEDGEHPDLQEPDWDNNSESQLKYILICMLDALYMDAIAKIVSFGYSQEVAMDAVLKNGKWNGKDALTSVVENSLSWLQNGEPRQGILDFTNLKDMENHVLTEMICLLRKVCPFLSKGDAMWCLLVCDMNLLVALAMDDGVTPSTSKEFQANNSLPPELKASPGATNQNPMNGAVPLPQRTPSFSQADVQVSSGTTCRGPLGGLENISSESRSAFSTPSFSSTPSGKVAVANRHTNGRKASSMHKNVQSPSIHYSNRNLNQEIKSSGVRYLNQEMKSQVFNAAKVHKPITTKAEMPEQQRSGSGTCCCSNHINNMNNVTFSATSHIKDKMNFNDMNAVLKKEKQILKILRNHCYAHTLRHTTGSNLGEQENYSDSYSSLIGLKCMDGCVAEVESKGKDFQTACNVGTYQVGCADDKEINVLAHEVELCLTTTPGDSSGISSNLAAGSCKAIPTSSKSYDTVSSDQILQWTWADGEQRKAEILLQLIDRIKHLESQLQEWSEWAQQKVMQAAQRLRKDSAELKALRLERDECDRLRKEKQSLEENTVKKLSEVENALRKALSQVDRANTTAHRLETENAEVRGEMEVAKLTAAEYTSACQEMEKRENRAVKDPQAWEKQKMRLQSDLADQKRKLTGVLQQLTQAKELHHQAEVKWRHEKDAKEEALALLDFEKRTKEEVQLGLRQQEEAFHRKAQVETQCQHEEVQRLQSEISRLRLSLGFQPTLLWLHSKSDLKQSCSIDTYKQINSQLSAEIMSLKDSKKEFHRNHACVFCTGGKLCIVFLPCAHQVICIQCNELHLKKGLKDCPSCRTPIQERIRVYGVDST
ncbi:hypothetical protein KP509_16G079400 [Ceratopteris richardii]|uniref:PIR2-like helical domain-containing protein n=1 Tax=Ceratopteris richardii TaxID=49495 RepID=A0A8T2T4G3_CERRI|nr:hypothetical protein KP509_16G079400 [Ceratopteris richardii]KAH7388516.1 hypothetical protein KP509_16G079400 [Ceratopteris richardii]